MATDNRSYKRESSYDTTYPTYFPPQKIPVKQKTKKWARQCVRAATDMTAFEYNTSVRTSLRNKKINYDMANGIINPTDMRSVGIPVEGTDIHIRDYPIAKPRLNVLIGESARMRFRWSVRTVNEDAVTAKETELKDEVFRRVAELMQNAYQEDEEKLKEKLQAIDNWRNFEFLDIRERMANMILKYYERKAGLKDLWMKGMEDALWVSEEIYAVEPMGTDMDIRNVNPMNLRTMRMGQSTRIEDAGIIVEEVYYPLGSIIDMDGEELKDVDIKHLEEKTYSYRQTGDIIKYAPNAGPVNMPASIWYDGAYPGDDCSTDTPADAGFDGMFLNADEASNTYKYRPYDEAGNIRRSRVVWRSMRKIGVATYIDELGYQQKTMFDERINTEDFPPGTKIKWMWVPQWWEGVRIGYDIYVKLRPRPLVLGANSKYSAGGPGYIGTVYNIGINTGMSMFDIIKPYEYLYSEIMDRFRKAIKLFKMPQAEVDLAKIPRGWDIDKWLYFAEETGYLFVDSFKEGDKGEAQGKLAGSVGNTSGKIYNYNMGNYIQQLVEMLTYIDQQVSLATGISPQRMGQIDNRETVGGVERSVMQSSHITEKLMQIHRNTRLRLLTAILETAKFVWRGKKPFVLQYILDDMSIEMLNVDPQLLDEAVYGLFLSDSDSDNELFQTIKTLAQALIQNGKMNTSALIDVYTSPDMATMKRKIERQEQRAEEAEQQMNKIKSQELQDQKEREDRELDLKEREVDIKERELEFNIQTELAGLSEEAKKNIDEAQFKADSISIDREKIRSDESMHDKDVNVAREKIAADKQKVTQKST